MRAGQFDLFATPFMPPAAPPAATDAPVPAGELLALIEALTVIAEITSPTSTDRVVVCAAAWAACQAAYRPLLRRWMDQPIAGRPLPGVEGVYLAAMHRMDIFVCGQERRGIIIAAREFRAAQDEIRRYRAGQPA